MSTSSDASWSAPLPKAPWAPTIRGSSLLLGSLLDMRADALGLMHKAARQGDVVRFRFVNKWAHLISHPDDVKRILVDNHKNYNKQTPGWKVIRIALGNGLLTSEGDFWRRQRRIAQPAFHHKSISGFADTMQTSTLEMLSEWDRRGPEIELDLDAEMMRLTLQIAGLTLFSTDLADQSNVVGKALSVVLHEAMERTMKLVHAPLWVPTPKNQMLKRAISDLDEVVYALIERRRKDEPGRHMDLLSMLLAARDEETGEGMSDKQLRDELLTLVLAGHETTANALTWTFWLLAEHPEVADRLGNELEQVLGGRAPQLDDLPALEYTEAVIKESMRLRPPAWLTGRAPIEDDEVGGFHIPKDSIVFVCMYSIHRDPRFWKNPAVFDPDRFMNGAADDLPKYAYMPFGGGPRICIGNAFAMMEAKILLATIAQRRRMKLQEGFVPEMDPVVTLRPKSGMKMLASTR